MKQAYKLQGKQKNCSECGAKLIVKVLRIPGTSKEEVQVECPNGLNSFGWDGHDYYFWINEEE